MSSKSTRNLDGQHSTLTLGSNASSTLNAQINRLSAVYGSPEQERINYLEGRLVELMKQLEDEKTKTERLSAALDERDDQLSECRTELIQAYETSMQTRADMLVLLQKLQRHDTSKETQEADTSED
ncbi:hypothetical protein PHYPSEUDO_006395 [Phytophthora pseudosyringae]|uniref:Uncharacterized protein n=1 Tax=Phytophthora pseudosyringae TaxID=221518 RepID=A0A8T1WCE2_9STRA|nr:hypothetical protein PHYPSEUDO_006395 [Phytophthora pseudosyringae]